MSPGSILSKLGFSSRAQIAAWMVTHPLAVVPGKGKDINAERAGFHAPVTPAVTMMPNHSAGFRGPGISCGPCVFLITLVCSLLRGLPALLAPAMPPRPGPENVRPGR
jgi:hypothetical protein